MAKKFQSLKEKMSPEAQKRAEVKKQKMLDALPIRKLREELHIDQEYLAELLDIQQPAVSKQEARANPGINTLKRYVEALGGTLEIKAKFPQKKKSIRLM